MKKSILIIGFILSYIGTYAQNTMNALKPQETLHISDVNTTHLIFTDKIKYLDIGSPYFIADTIQSIVKIKHTGEISEDDRSKNSNLTIITNKGTFHSIPLRYMRNTTVFSYRMQAVTEKVNKVEVNDRVKQNELYRLHKLCDEFTAAQSNIILTEERDDLRIKVIGIFYKNDHIAIRLNLRNSSTIDFDIDDILIRLKLRKRIASDYIYQERLVRPVKVCNETAEVKGGQSSSMILIFDKFTPNDNEDLYIDALEQNGGRSCTIKIPRKRMLAPKVVTGK